MGKSRIKNTLNNSIVGLLSYLITSIISFISRAIFIRILGVEYLGISGLYSNLLAVLALSDLGISTVMVYSLYKPLADSNTKQIASLIKYYEKLYRLVATVILCLGMMCVPLLPFIIKDSGLAQQDLILYYILVLANSVCSYLAITKSTLFRADQRIGIIQSISSITSLCMHMVQIAVLILFHNYTMYLCIPILFTLINNVVLTLIADKKYPYLKEKYDNSVGEEVRYSLISNLKATFLYKLGATIINSTDNIIISMMLGTIVVGYYNNYYMVVSLVNAIISILINAVIASIGNFNATKDSTQKFMLFRMLLFAFFVLASFSSACYFAIFNDFIRIWIGDTFLLGDGFILALVVNQAVVCISNPLWMTREASGMFKSVRYVMISAAIINVFVSIVLAETCGLAGIIFATAIARLLTLFWYEPKMLCENVFDVPLSKYWKNECFLFLAYLPACGVGWLLHSLNTTNIIMMILKVALCGLVTIVSFVLVFYKRYEIKQCKTILKKIKHF